MNLNVTQKILVGYVVGFILLLAFATLTLFNGKKIEATTIALSKEKIPSLIAASSLKGNLQMQINQLYALYATNDHEAFQASHQHTMLTMQQYVTQLRTLEEYKSFDAALAVMSAKQTELANNFVQIMKQPEVDWDGARAALSAFSQSANEMDVALDKLVKTVSDETLTGALDSQQLTEQLINVVWVLTAFVFLGVLAMAFYSHRQVAMPLRNVSNMLRDITNRRDLTYRLTQRSYDEVGDIVVSTNQLLDEFQKLARTLDGTTQEVNRTMKNLTDITTDAKVNLVDRNTKLRNATQDFMRDIEISSKVNGVVKEVDAELHRAQMKFIQSHLSEIDEGTQVTDRNISALQASTNKLQKLAENMRDQIRLLNF
jgi:methyl-accepting chemotaxis protein